MPNNVLGEGCIDTDSRPKGCMLFNSWQFILFFPAVTCLYFVLHPRFRWVLLLGASYFFYMCWKPSYLVLILISTLVDYVAALFMGRTGSLFKRKFLLALSLLVNLGLLLFFKYFNFFNESLRQVFHHFSFSYDIPQADILLPVGISFYTFQTLSYTIEVYRGRREPERHLGYFALYVSYFPQLVAGPIERPGNLLPQLKGQQDFDYRRVTDGLGRIVWGMFKKVVIADRLGLVVDSIYSQPDQFGGPALTVATVAFAFQIYCDFSGYSDIAIGAAKVMGHRLMENFDRPYFACSIADFWRRWHISLSSWFRDYLYVPLGGSRVRFRRFCFNILAVFILSGLWHGASWTFVIWGCLHGLYYLIGRGTRGFRQGVAQVLGAGRFPRLRHAASVTITFLLVCFAWILFRANSFSDAVTVVSRLGTGWANIWTRSGFETWLSSFNVPEKEIWRGFVLTGLLVLIEYLQGPARVTEIMARWNRPLRWAAYLLLVLVILNLGVTKKIPFVYFQF